MAEIKSHVIEYLKSLNFNGLELKVEKYKTDSRLVLKSIGMEEVAKDTYKSDTDVSMEFDEVLESGEVYDKFEGIQISPMLRLKSTYELQSLKKDKKTGSTSWKFVAYKSNPFQYATNVRAMVNELTSSMAVKLDGLKTYHVQITEWVSFRKSEKDFQWYIKTNCYPMSLELSIWKCIEQLLQVDKGVSIEEYETMVDKACKLILEAEISDKIPLKLEIENADNSIIEEE
jgi:hypothetical protein